MTRKTTVLCSGSIVLDILLRPVQDSAWGTTQFVESLEYHAGGNGATTARALGALGTPVRLLGAIGRDDQGKFVLDIIARSGVDTSAVTAGDAPTATTIVMVSTSGDRKFLHRLGASAEVFRTPLRFTPKLTTGIAHYHMGSLFVLPELRRHAPQMLKDACAAGLTTSVDVNWDVTGSWMGTLSPCLPHVDVLFLNQDEARMTTGCTDAAAAARIVLDMGVRVAAIKLGGHGCAIYTSCGSEWICPAFEVEVRDTTGAGDCFAAGFLHAWLGGAGLAESGQFANAVAGLSVQRLGAAVGIPSATEVRRWMEQATAEGLRDFPQRQT